MEDARLAIEAYQESFRNPKLPPLMVSDLYDLFPPNGVPEAPAVWPDPWPGGEFAGVYLVIAADHSMVYVGKASMNSAIAVRLSSHFVFDDQRNCRIKHPQSWKGEPRYVATVAMKHEYRFEAPALEEYLIAKLRTTDNKAGSGGNDV